MKQIEELAKAAVGFDSKRGDQFSLQNISFTQPLVETPAPVGKMQRILVFAERWTGLLRYVALLVLFGLVYFLLLRPVKQHFVALLQSPIRSSFQVSGGAGRSVAAIGSEGARALSVESAVSSEVQQAVALKKQLVGKVKEDPQAASRLIQNWLRETGAPK
jgi:flagellar M-ring protein FliF